MPTTFGTAGAYVRELQASCYRWRHATNSILLFITGVVLGLVLQCVAHPGWWGGSISLALGLALWGVARWSDGFERRLREDERRAKQGAEGEERVEDILSKLPGDHVVIHDLVADYGNIDHIVVAPHGVFAIETKSHRGCLSTENGTLLLNGRPPVKDCVGQTRRSALWLKDRIRERTGLTVYVHGLLVFTRGFTAKPLPEIGGVQILTAFSLLRTLKRPRKTTIPVDRVVAAIVPAEAAPVHSAPVRRDAPVPVSPRE